MKIFILKLLFSLVSTIEIKHYEEDLLINFDKKLNISNDPECYKMTHHEDRSFLNGMIRKYKPKKILEVGVNHGCSSAVILNAIKDIKGAFLYSIDLAVTTIHNTNKTIGHFVNDKCPELANKWKLYKGGYTCQFIEEIGKDIDFVFLDTLHSLPGEALDILMFLPFVKENAIVVLHDVCYRRYKPLSSNDKLFGYLKGEKILPRNPKNGFANIGGIILSKNQEEFYFDYFWLASFNWSFLPKDKDLDIILKFYKKYYDNYYIEMFEQAIKINKKNHAAYIKKNQAAINKKNIAVNQNKSKNITKKETDL